MFEIIPAIDIIDGQCVRLEQGDYKRQTTYKESPVKMGREWEQAGASLIHIVDLDGARNGKPTNLSVIGSVCETLSCSCELGGGIRTEKDIRDALNTGISRVILGTTLAEKPEFAKTLVSKFGVDRIVAGIDARNGKIAVRGWQEESSTDVIHLAKTLYGFGIRHFIYTDIATDGMFTGPNVEGITALCTALENAFFTASGGIGSDSHVKQLVSIDRGNLEGVIVGKALYDGKVTFEDLRKAIYRKR